MNIVYRNSTEGMSLIYGYASAIPLNNVLSHFHCAGGTTLEVDNFRQAGIAFINEWSMDFAR